MPVELAGTVRHVVCQQLTSLHQDGTLPGWQDGTVTVQKQAQPCAHLAGLARASQHGGQLREESVVSCAPATRKCRGSEVWWAAQRVTRCDLYLQRGIAVAGINAYEDSDLYLAPPPPLPDSDADLAADLLAADGEPGANATGPPNAPAAPPEPAPQVR